jgi:hypothetical protein
LIGVAIVAGAAGTDEEEDAEDDGVDTGCEADGAAGPEAVAPLSRPWVAGTM